MGRLCPQGFRRLYQCLPGDLHLTFGGAEANVAASIAMLGGQSRFITALPENDISLACLDSLRSLGIDISHVVRTDKGRLGLYFMEPGINQRPGRVLYDREHSSVSLMPASAYNWEAAFTGAAWFHVTGITPALSEVAAETTVEAVKQAKDRGIPVSCDLNFRKKLWKWKPSKTASELAGETMRQILPYVDTVIGNEEDAFHVLGIQAANTHVQAGKIDAQKYSEVAEKIIDRFDHVSRVAITLRESISATHNNWGAMLYTKDSAKAAFAPLSGNSYQPYEIHNIVDRVGAGDAFAAALIFALNLPEFKEPGQAVAFAAAASCLAHSVYGDFNYTKRSEVEALLENGGSGRVIR